MTKKLKEYRFSLATPDSRLGRPGSIGTGKVPRGKSRGGYSGDASYTGNNPAAAASFPYNIEVVIDDDDEDLDPIDAELVDKLQSKIGAMRFRNDPGAKSKDIPVSSRVAESLPSVGGRIPASVLYPKKNRGPAIGGVSMSPASYRTGPGHARTRDPGTLQGNSKPPRDDFDDGERVFNLSDMIEPENKVVIRVRKMVRDILSADSKE